MLLPSLGTKEKNGLVSLSCPRKFFDAKQAPFPLLWCAQSMTVPISWAQHSHPSLRIKKWALRPKDVRACANTSAESIPVDGKENDSRLVSPSTEWRDQDLFDSPSKANILAIAMSFLFRPFASLLKAIWGSMAINRGRTSVMLLKTYEENCLSMRVSDFFRYRYRRELTIIVTG